MRTVKQPDGSVVRRPAEVQLAIPLDVPQTQLVGTWTIWLPWLPKSKNVYANWPATWKSAEKKRWVNRIVEECEAQLIPKGAPKVGLFAELWFATRNRRGDTGTNRDYQNYAEMLWHYVPDALVKAGVVTDDTAEQIQIGPNWGLAFKYDLNETRPKKDRERTRLILAVPTR